MTGRLTDGTEHRHTTRRHGHAKTHGDSSARCDSHRERLNRKDARANPDDANSCGFRKADGVGFEGLSVSPCQHSHLRRRARRGEAKGEAVCPTALLLSGSDCRFSGLPPELLRLAATWDRLLPAVRAGIVAMVDACVGGDPSSLNGSVGSHSTPPLEQRVHLRAHQRPRRSDRRVHDGRRHR